MLDLVLATTKGRDLMSEETIRVRIASDKKAALDAIAVHTHRDLEGVIEEALSAYIDLHASQVAHLKEGLRQADAGEFASDAEVSEAFARWRR
jgi:RHH-type transcriptional regulator, rel operon repressor / antitoxin RelB